MFDTLDSFAAAWLDTPECHQLVRDVFTANVNDDAVLKAHRDYVEEFNYGFGERPFHFFWKLVVDQLPKLSRMLEVGVYRGATVSLWGLLAQFRWSYPSAITAVSTFDGRGLCVGDNGWTEPEKKDYRQDVRWICSKFSVPYPDFIVGDSTHAATAFQAESHGPFDVVYIDGSHEAKDVEADLRLYAPMVKPGGLLVCDDAGCGLNLPSGFFPGFPECSATIDRLLPRTVGEFCGIHWGHLGNVVHLRAWRRV